MVAVVVEHWNVMQGHMTTVTEVFFRIMLQLVVEGEV